MTKKSVIKGNRLRFYPDKFRLFSCSKGIKRPKLIYMTYSEAKNLVHNRSPDYGYTNHIIYSKDGEEHEVNAITYLQYVKNNNKKENIYYEEKKL